MNERDFEILEVLALSRNITKAASLLYITQSALSKRIQVIEEELGYKLFVRSRQGIHLTPEGEIVLEYTSQAAKSLKAMRAVIESSKGYITGTLNIGVSINYALNKFPELLTQYINDYPHVNTHMTTNHSRKVYQQLLQGSIDVAIIRGDFPWDGNKHLLDQEVIYLISSIQFDDVGDLEIPYINRKTDVKMNKDISQWFAENNVHINTTGFYVDNINTCVEMVNNGLGWAIVPEICLKDFKGFKYPLVFKDGTPFLRSTYLAYPESSLDLPQVRVFVDTLLK